jgi:transposase
MSTIIRKKIGKQTYLYESVSYRNAEGQPRNKRKLVGKIDLSTGEPLYKAEYLERMTAAGTPIELSPPKPMFSIDAIKNSTVKEFGAFYLFKSIAQAIGLYGILKETFPYRWEQLFNLACYVVANGEPVMYCEDWLTKTDGLPCNSLAPQRITELFQSISQEERMMFFERWGAFRSEREYLALDITSVSSYSELIADVEWGYNRDKEKLPQINLCMLMGEKSRLPVFQTPYCGSLKDVSTLKTTLQLASNLPLGYATLVMDKGFCSVKNINAMLSDSQGFKFLIAMSFTLSFTKNQVASEQKDIDRLENTIVVGEDVLRGVTKERSWNAKFKLFTHIYYNAIQAAHTKDKLYGRIAKLVEYAKLKPEDPQHVEDFKRYLIIRKSEKADFQYTINIRHDVVEEELSHSGWLVLVSNHIDNAKDAICIYRAKDVVEKGFMRLKNCLDLGRLRVHSDNCMQNKVFIGFISLILMSAIHNVMFTKELYRNTTMKSMIKTLEKLRVQHINGTRILFPLTKEQKEFFDAFNISYPL